MHARLKSLIERGYLEEDVIRLSSFSEEELDYACNIAFEHITRDCNRVESPKTVFIGGQPGCGKTVLSLKLKNRLKNIIEIGIDNYRMYHPHYLEIEEYIKDFWKEKEEGINDTPGNDIADFTHVFAGAMTDRLIEMGCSKDSEGNSYNMILEWGMRDPDAPLETMRDLKDKNYDNVVMFVATNKEISYKACELRADVMKNSGRIIRKVPKSFHDVCLETLPESIDTIYKEGFKENIIDYMAIVTRDGKIKWDNKEQTRPGVVYNNLLHSSDNDYVKNNADISLKTNETEMIGLNKELEELKQLKDNILYYSYFSGTTSKTK